MSVKNSKANESLEYFLHRIDEIRMSERERMNAKIRFERADAVAAALVSGARAVARLFASPGPGAGRSPATKEPAQASA
jgi:hypothetical protein